MAPEEASSNPMIIFAVVVLPQQDFRTVLKLGGLVGRVGLANDLRQTRNRRLAAWSRDVGGGSKHDIDREHLHADP